MSKQELLINYRSIPNIKFTSKKSAADYLNSEKLAWSDFLEETRKNSWNGKILSGNYNATRIETQAPFDALLSIIDTPPNFSRATELHGSIGIPPPSASIEGQLILGLHNNGKLQHAEDAFLAFLNLNYNFKARLKSQDTISLSVERGDFLLAAAHACAAIPFRRTTTKQMSEILRASKSDSESLAFEVQKAEQLNKDHQHDLTEFRTRWRSRARKIATAVVKKERNRDRVFKNWIEDKNLAVAERFKLAEGKLEAIDKLNRRIQDDRQKEFDRLLILFHEQLRLRAPVKLWENRCQEHSKKSKNAGIKFATLTIIALAASAFIPFQFGDYIANSFFQEFCSRNDPLSCNREFSAKGPLTISGILVIMSIFLWTIRLQYKVYLSERHLSLDASERKAFAETYLAMKEGAEVSEASEAIVLASLFRPTQDGIIADEDNHFDLGSAAILAKHLGRNG
jgi:hypothetical protein